MADIYLHLNGESKGPFPPEHVRAMLASGEITPDTLAWHEGLTEWGRVAAILPPPSTPSAPLSPSMPPIPAKKGMSGWLIALIVVAGVSVLSLPCCCGIALGPIMNGIQKAKENMAMQQARQIALAINAYANDHNGRYPDASEPLDAGAVVTLGKSNAGAATSTEVFQKLLDGKYIASPAVFYISMPGKVKAEAGAKLTAENVCFDVTAGVTGNSPAKLPLVYTTGYEVNFSSDGTITPSTSGPASPFPGLAMGYRDGSARFWPLTRSTTTLPIMPLGTYRQLKP